MLGILKSLNHSSPAEWAAKHRDLGLFAVTFPLDSTYPHDVIRDYCEAAAEAGLSFSEVGVWRPLLCADPEARAANIDYAVCELQLADEIGARCCVDFIGTYQGIRTEPSPNNATAEAYQATVETVRTVIDRAGVSHAKFTLEAMRDEAPRSPEEELKLIADIDRDGFGVHLDPFNWVRTPDDLKKSGELVDRCFDLLGDRILSCHLKDLVPDGDGVREVMCGKGEFDLGRYVGRVAQIPGLPIMIEHLQSTSEYLEAVELMRRLYPDIG